MESHKHHPSLFFEGSIMILLGLIAAALPFFFSKNLELLIGSVLLATAFLQILRISKARELPEFPMVLLIIFAYFIFGVLLIVFHVLPDKGVLSLLLAVFLAIEGITKLAWGATSRYLIGRGWLIWSGIIALLAMAAILWPASPFWIIGPAIGINLGFLGLALISLSQN